MFADCEVFNREQAANLPLDIVHMCTFWLTLLFPLKCAMRCGFKYRTCAVFQQPMSLTQADSRGYLCR